MATVEQIITDQQAFATTCVGSANEFLAKLEDIADSHWFVMADLDKIPDLGYTFDSTDDAQALLLGLFPEDITVGTISATLPLFTPVEVDMTGVDDVTVPSFNSVAPTLNIPTPPTNALPSMPAAPSVTDPVLPTAPTLSLPTAPEVTGITFPSLPSIEIPTFSSSMPIDDLVAPSNTFTFNEELYASALLDELKAKLLYDLENGGYGIEPNDELHLFDRARSRANEVAAAESSTLLANAAGRGFAYPPGDLNVALQKTQEDLLRTVSAANRDIMLKRADMYVENRKFTIQETRQLESILIGFHNSRMERALNAAKISLDATISIFNAQVLRYNARLDGYKADAQVFEARVRAQLAQVELYRVQMDGKRIEVDVQRAQVEVYNAQLAGVRAVVDIYTAQLGAARVQADIERLRIEAFRALIDGYSAQVQAKVAEFDMFEAQIRGEVARMNAFESEVRAYTATVEGAKAKADVQVALLRARIAVSEQAIETFKAQIEGYKADISAQAQTINSRVQVYSSKIQAGAAKSQAVSEAYRLDVTKKDLEAKRNYQNALIAIEDAKIMLQGLISSAASRTDASRSAATYFAALISGAVQSLTTLSAKIQQE